jgi:hypothetical protein
LPGETATTVADSETPRVVEHAGHSSLIGSSEIVQVPGKGQHRKTTQGIGPVNGKSGIGRSDNGFIDIFILVEHVKHTESQFPILFLE